jgi:flagellar basal-body rod protein FlgB
MAGSIGQVDLLTKLLDVGNLRQRVIAQNVANVNTPGYQRLEVKFEDAFSRELARNNPTSAVQVGPKVVASGSGPVRADGNDVDIDAEIGRMTKNALLMNAYTQILASKIAAQRAAISGRS